MLRLATTGACFRGSFLAKQEFWFGLLAPRRSADHSHTQQGGAMSAPRSDSSQRSQSYWTALAFLSRRRFGPCAGDGALVCGLNPHGRSLPRGAGPCKQFLRRLLAVSGLSREPQRSLGLGMGPAPTRFGALPTGDKAGREEISAIRWLIPPGPGAGRDRIPRTTRDGVHDGASIPLGLPSPSTGLSVPTPRAPATKTRPVASNPGPARPWALFHLPKCSRGAACGSVNVASACIRGDRTSLL